jgi:hypothetical protein
MASYASYKKIPTEQITDGTLTKAALVNSSGGNFSVFQVFGSPSFCSAGCCCLWTVPSGVQKVTFELWGAGGNGNGACSNGRCQHYSGAQGGYYNSKTIVTKAGCEYTICAGGVYPCLSNECVACNGCASYVTGYNLSGFCAIGGRSGIGDGAWSTGCFSEFPCCVAPVAFGGDFGMGNHAGAAGGHEFCHCEYVTFCSTGAPFLSGAGSHGYMTTCWIRCGCWSAPYGSGGQSAMTTYCGGCCGQGGTGGPGLVKITYV